MKVICDACEKEFEIKEYAKKLTKDIVEHGFNCTHCNKKYISYYTNSKIRKLMLENRKLYEALSTKKKFEGKKIMEKIIDKTEAIEKLMKEIKERVIDGL